MRAQAQVRAGAVEAGPEAAGVAAVEPEGTAAGPAVPGLVVAAAAAVEIVLAEAENKPAADSFAAKPASLADNRAGAEPAEAAARPCEASAARCLVPGPLAERRGAAAAPDQRLAVRSANPAEVGASPAGVGRLPYCFPVDPLGLFNWPQIGSDLRNACGVAAETRNARPLFLEFSLPVPPPIANAFDS